MLALKRLEFRVIAGENDRVRPGHQGTFFPAANPETTGAAQRAGISHGSAISVEVLEVIT
jgi:hypothetical protein